MNMYTKRVNTKPPDKGDGGGSPSPETACSFRDKLLGNKKAQPRREKMDLIAEGLVTVDLVGGNRLLPKIIISKDMFKELCHPWQEALIVKLLGKSVGYRIMQHRLSVLWKLSGGFELMDVDHGYYMVKFDLEEDREKVIGGGPWMIFDHYLAVSKWSPDFVSTTAKVEKTLVWIRFPGMNLVYYDESLLLAMASVVGKPIKVDEHTLRIERGRFARVCVEIDLNQPVVGKICVNDTWYKIEYEGLHVLCGRCGCYGHVTRNCTTKIVQEERGAEAARETQTAAVAPVQSQPTKGAPYAPPNPDSVAAIAKSTEAFISNDEATTDHAAVSAEILEPTHGEWLTVTRRKKQHGAQRFKARNKEQSTEDLGNKFQLLSHDEHRLSGPKIIQSNKFAAGPSGTKEVAQALFNPKKWAKKRPRREEQNARKNPTQLQIKDVVHPKSKMTPPGQATLTTKIPIKDLGAGIKTTLNLVQISKNHFKMQDDVVDDIPKVIDQVSGGQPHASGVGTTKLLSIPQHDSNDDDMDCENSRLQFENDSGKNVNEVGHSGMQT